MEELQRLKQRCMEDGRPNLVAIVDEAIAAKGEYTNVMVKAHHADPDFANELNAIVLDLIVCEELENVG